MTPDIPRRIPPDISNRLADISAHVEPIAANNPSGSDFNVLAHAIYNLARVVEDLYGHG
jgi:hypothetical protein